MTEIFKKFAQIKNAKRVASHQNKDKVDNMRLPPHFPIETAEHLLDTKEYYQIRKDIHQLAHAPQEHYIYLYKGAIENFAEFVQQLPARRVKKFNYHGGMLTLALERAKTILKLYREEYPIGDIEAEKMPAKLALWSYALFTAALFYGVGQIAATYWVSLCDANGKNSHRWQPIAGSMLDSHMTHYRYSFDETTSWEKIETVSSALFATMLIPKKGMAWIASNKEIYLFWLSILQNDERWAGKFSQYMLSSQIIVTESQLALDSLLQEPLDKDSPVSLSEQQDEQKHSQHHQEDPTIPLEKDERDVGRTFLAWLRKQIQAGMQDGNFTINQSDSYVHVIDGIVYIKQEAYQAFAKQQGKSADHWHVIMQEFEHSGYTVNRNQAKSYMEKNPHKQSFGKLLAKRDHGTLVTIMTDPTYLFTDIPANSQENFSPPPESNYPSLPKSTSARLTLPHRPSRR